jgi:hypothetical protein
MAYPCTAPNCRQASRFRWGRFIGRCIRWQRPFPAAVGELIVGRLARMDLPILIVLGIAVALILFLARPGGRKRRRASDRPRLWDSTPGTESAALFGLTHGGDTPTSRHGSGHSDHDSGFHSSTNAPPDGGKFQVHEPHAPATTVIQASQHISSKVTEWQD